MDDESIIILFENRNENALTAVKNKYERIILSTAHNFLRDNRDAEECVNDTYLGLWNTIPPKHPERLLAYICSIVRNLALKKVEYNSAYKRRAQFDVSLDELEDCIPDNENDDGEMLGRLLNSFLATLDSESRKIFVRRYWSGDSISDISDFFSLNESKVKVTLFRLRKKLHQYLITEGYTI